MDATQQGPADRVIYRITDEYALVTRERSPFLYLEWREGGKPVRRSTGSRDLDGAKRRARELILELADIRDAQPAAALVSAVLERYYLRHGKKIPSASTIKRSVKLWSTFFRTETVADLTPDAQRDFRRWLEDQGYSQGYVRRVIGDGKAAINRAWQDGELTSAPFIRLPAMGASYPHYARFEQLVTFLNAPMPDHLFLYCMIRLNTGCRGDAARDLQPFQVDDHAKLIDLNPAGRIQTKKFRPVVPLTAFLEAHLQARTPVRVERDRSGRRRRPRRDDGTYVQWNGKKLSSVRRAWNEAREAAGLPLWFQPKILRHTVGTELRRRGVPGWDVSGQLGHKKGESAPTTENYAKFDPDYLAKAKAAFEAWMGELAARVPRMRDATAMPQGAERIAETRTAQTSGGRAVAGVQAPVSLVGGTGFEPVTPTMSTWGRVRRIND